MKRVLSIILSFAMLLSLVPAAFAQSEDLRETVVVNFARCEGLKNSYAYERDSSKGAKDIDGTNFTTIDAETTTKTGGNTRNDNITTKENGSNYKVNGSLVYFLMVMFDATVWDGKVYQGTTGAPTINNLGRWTLEIDMGTTTAGWYDLVIRGANNYVGGIFDVYVDREYVGEYNCRSLCALTYGEHITKDFGKVFLSPDANGKVKVAFVIKENAYTSATDSTISTSDTRLLLEDIVFTPSEAPVAAEAKSIETKLSWNTMYYFGVDESQEIATYAVPSENWITSGFELVLDSEKMTETTCRYTPQTIDKTEYFTQLRVGAGVWPSKQNAMFTIKRKVAAEGWYRVDVQGVLNTDSSDFAIYVNGEFAGDYNFDNTKTDSNYLGEKKQLNTVWLDSGENEISFRARTKNYASNATFIPYTVDLIPASEPAVASIENTATAMTLVSEVEQSFTARVKMADGTYRSFGYNDDGSLPVSDDVVIVKSSNESVVEITECVNVESVDVDDISATLDPTTVAYSIKAVGAGTSDITVIAIVNGNTMESESVTITVPETQSESEVEKAPTVSFFAESSDNTNAPITVSAKDKDGNDVLVKTLATLNRGASVTVTAPETQNGYVFRGWLRGSAENGRLISVESVYTFNAMTHTMLTAVYTEDTATEEYYNWNGEFLGTADPGTPTLLGYVFDSWAKDIVSNITRYVAQYKKTDTEYNVELPQDVTTVKDESSYYYDTEVTMTAESDVFWLRDGNVVDFGKTYTFYIWDDTTVTTGSVGDSSIPKVFLDIAKDNAHMIEYDKGDFTIVEVGILFGNAGDELTIESCEEKMNSQRNSAHGQFAASSEYAQARGYLIYQDGSEYKVIYSE